MMIFHQTSVSNLALILAMTIWSLCSITATARKQITELAPAVPSARLRGLKKNNGGGGSVANDGLREIHTCVDFDKIPELQKTSSMGDSECSTNTCSNGCCRVYNWLLCDTSNSFPTLACVCNERTQSLDSFVPYNPAPVDVPIAQVPPGYAPGSTPARRPGTQGGGGKKMNTKKGMMMK